jgi:ribosome maturation protein SDO1
MYVCWWQILDKGELQVAGKERESQLSNQFRDIATIVMEKTFNVETQRPYTISMIERLMHEIHFAVDPNSSSKKQVIQLLHFDGYILMEQLMGL